MTYPCEITERISLGELQIARVLYDFVNQEALPDTARTAELLAWCRGVERMANQGLTCP